MDKTNLKTGQLLGVIEKNGKLVREYVAGFFGDEPIIKQRLMTPREARIYREDLEKGRSEGRTGSEAAEVASGMKATSPGRRLAKKPKLARRGDSKTAPISRRARPGQERSQEEETVVSADQPRIRRRSPDQASDPLAAQAPGVESPSMGYVSENGGVDQTYIQTLIDAETEKPNFVAGNTQKAIAAINRLGCPDMKIYRVGQKSGDEEGESYSQKEYMARDIMGLPLWKSKPATTESPDQADA